MVKIMVQVSWYACRVSGRACSKAPNGPKFHTPTSGQRYTGCVTHKIAVRPTHAAVSCRLMSKCFMSPSPLHCCSRVLRSRCSSFAFYFDTMVDGLNSEALHADWPAVEFEGDHRADLKRYAKPIRHNVWWKLTLGFPGRI